MGFVLIEFSGILVAVGVEGRITPGRVLGNGRQSAEVGLCEASWFGLVPF